MLNHHDRIAGIAKLQEKRHQLRNVVKVKPRRRLVEKVERLAGGTARQFRCEFDALRLAAGERRRRLSQPQITETDIHKRLELVGEPRYLRKEFVRLGDRHVQHFGDVLAAVADFQRLLVEASPVALFAGHIDIRQKAHLQLAHAIPPARLAAAALHVEAETPRRVAARLRPFGLRKQLADVGEEPHVGRRVRTRGAPDRRLVDLDDLIDQLVARQLPELPRLRLRMVEAAHQFALERLVDQRRFSGTGDARDDGERAERNPHRDVLKVVLGAAAQGEEARG